MQCSVLDSKKIIFTIKPGKLKYTINYTIKTTKTPQK